jgi:aldehyde dehydrogenase (NAD+)
MKFSEIAPNIGILLSKLMPKYLDMTSIALVMGAVPEATLLLEQKFDLIFFVGNITVGKIVMEAAAKNLTPVILELGGKAPAIVDETSCPQIAARRIIWGKIVNCGQTCIAPDYGITVLTQSFDP